MTTANGTRYLFTREALLGGFGLGLTVTPVSGDDPTAPFGDAGRWRWRVVARFSVPDRYVLAASETHPLLSSPSATAGVAFVREREVADQFSEQAHGEDLPNNDSQASSADMARRGRPFEQILNARTAGSKHLGHRLRNMFGAVLFTIGVCVVVAIARATLRFERNHAPRR